MPYSYLTDQDVAELNRLQAAKRGTLRIEVNDTDVVIAHCTNYETIELVRLDHVCWYVHYYSKDRKRGDAQFNNSLSAEQLDKWIVGIAP